MEITATIYDDKGTPLSIMIRNIVFVSSVGGSRLLARFIRAHTRTRPLLVVARGARGSENRRVVRLRDGCVRTRPLYKCDVYLEYRVHNRLTDQFSTPLEG